ncbi:conserved hypothetical protein [Vibrio chagasii]|uniref:hypothetical protein n=1 Tax=Vibrio TaxID=662 RepID=UPI000769A7BD|nr:MULTISPECIES: hypothetical protein [Vibrio]CAH6819697.1 conserved hypothetical protein [Vibrio chagasii]CAH6859454.1 conserved hypothetical protein [Vibrio chagasii]CAH6867431.1 conserved hypothetical protein [Vibrio chagasii]CAH6902024.1 conserved hypothetical protein [Vibrio chagasii]CAH6922112.1 conserved hypothetical protein [Vibrio chagasii]
MPEIKQKNSQSVNQLLQEYKDVTSTESFQLDVVQSLTKIFSDKDKSIEHCDKVTLLKVAQQHIDQEIDFSLSVGFDDAVPILNQIRKVIEAA